MLCLSLVYSLSTVVLVSLLLTHLTGTLEQARHPLWAYSCSNFWVSVRDSCTKGQICWGGPSNVHSALT